MELNVEIDAIVLYGVERVDRDHVAAQIARRLEFRLLTEGLAQPGDHLSRGPVGGDGSEARRLSKERLSSAAGWGGTSIVGDASIGERVADAIWSKLRSGGQRE